MLPPTRNDDIVLVPREVPEDSVNSMGCIRDKYDFLMPGANEVGHAVSGRSKVLRKIYSNKSVYICLNKLESSLASSRDRDGNRTVGT